MKHLSVSFALFISSVNNCLIGKNPKLHISALNLQRITSMKAGVEFFSTKLCLLNPTILTTSPKLKRHLFLDVLLQKAYSINLLPLSSLNNNKKTSSDLNGFEFHIWYQNILICAMLQPFHLF